MCAQALCQELSAHWFIDLHIHPTLQMRKLRLREFIQLFQAHVKATGRIWIGFC